MSKERDRVLEIIDLAEKISKPLLDEALDKPTLNEQGQAITNLQMALAAAAAVIGAKFTKADPDEYTDKTKTFMMVVMRMARGEYKEMEDEARRATVEDEDDIWKR